MQNFSDKISKLYFDLIDDLRANSVKAKEILINEKFGNYPDSATDAQKLAFVGQFENLIQDLVLFPDEEILEKFRSFGFANRTLRWMVNIEDIRFELDKLAEIEGLMIVRVYSLKAIQLHLDTKFKTSMLEDFELTEIHNKVEKNKLSREFEKLWARRIYRTERNIAIKLDPYEVSMNLLFDQMSLSEGVDEAAAKKLFLTLAKGDTSMLISLLGKFGCIGISERQVHLEMFPLLKMIMKDVEMLSEVDFYARKELNYDSDYTIYRIARVKKIFRK
jgi:hypothetical protein